MRIALTIIFFLFINFVLILFPKLMPNVISGEKTLFWVFWVNGLFALMLILPVKASYIFSGPSRGSFISNAILNQLKKTKDSYSGVDNSTNSLEMVDRIKARKVATKKP
jgi:hypothetical protein